MTSLRIAWRNLARHRWRTALTLGGVAVAVALLVWTEAMMDSYFVTMVEAALGSSVGDVQVHDPRWVQRPMLQHALPAGDALLDRVRAAPGVAGAARRLTSFGIIGHEARSQVALVLGVEPEREPGLAKGLVAGQWLPSAPAGGPRSVVLGEGLARQLGVKPGDELVLLTQSATGGSADDLLTVRGVLKSGMGPLDRQGAWLTFSDLAFLLDLEGRAHELVVHAQRGAPPETVAEAVRAEVGQGDQALVRTWKQILPDLNAMIEVSRSSTGIAYVIIYLLAALGILNAQRMSALERKREFGVMMAIGMTPGALGRVVVVESLVLCALGAVVGVLLGGALSLYHTHYGLDLGYGEMSVMGFTLPSVFYFHFRWTMAVAPVVAVLGVGLLCGLWPAFTSARLHPARALAGRT